MELTYEQVIEWLDQYEVGADVVYEAVSGLSEKQLTTPPSPSKWSIAQIVAHLVDTELVMIHRMRTVMAEGAGTLHSFSQDAWVTALNVGTMPIDLSIATLRALRNYHARTLRNLQPDTLIMMMENSGTHDVDGCLSAFDLLQKTVTHLHHHTRQINVIRNKQ